MLIYNKHNLDIKLSIEDLKDGILVISTKSEKFSECCNVKDMLKI